MQLQTDSGSQLDKDELYLLEKKVKAVLLPTWQPVAAIAAHANISSRAALSMLKTRQKAWRIEHRTCWIDGFNRSDVFRIQPVARTMMVMGVTVPVVDDSDEGEL